MKKFIIIGAGGHAKVVADAIIYAGGVVEGFLDPNIEIGKTILDQAVLGGDDYLNNIVIEEFHLANGIGTTPTKVNVGNEIRKKIFKKYFEKGFSFPPIIHSSASVSKYSELGDGVQIMAGAIVQPSVKIGKNTIINTKSSIEHDCVIGDDCHIAPAATLCGGVTVGDNCFIGAGAIIYPGRQVKSGSVIAAGFIFK
jgi:UDP-perosamine 4-acetyltransferase